MFHSYKNVIVNSPYLIIPIGFSIAKPYGDDS